MQINLEILKADHFEPGFANQFCEMVITKIQMFKGQYVEFVRAKDERGLASIVHEMVATLKFLSLEEMCIILNQYKTINLESKVETESLLVAVNLCCDQLENSLQLFKHEVA